MKTKSKSGKESEENRNARSSFSASANPRCARQMEATVRNRRSATTFPVALVFAVLSAPRDARCAVPELETDTQGESVTSAWELQKPSLPYSSLYHRRSNITAGTGYLGFPRVYADGRVQNPTRQRKAIVAFCRHTIVSPEDRVSRHGILKKGYRGQFLDSEQARAFFGMTRFPNWSTVFFSMAWLLSVLRPPVRCCPTPAGRTAP